LTRLGDECESDELSEAIVMDDFDFRKEMPLDGGRGEDEKFRPLVLFPLAFALIDEGTRSIYVV
jgi:hypothetical protein